MHIGARARKYLSTYVCMHVREYIKRLYLWVVLGVVIVCAGVGSVGRARACVRVWLWRLARLRGRARV
jgi:hypothetical protein